MNTELRVIPITAIGEIPSGGDLGSIIAEALHKQGLTLQHSDVLVVTQKIVSKAEGRIVNLETIEPSAFAHHIAQQSQKDARHVEVILRESKRIVRMDRGVIISETRHGFICANAGVDESNIADAHHVVLLPEDPDRSAQALRSSLQRLTHREQPVDIAIIISDTWGRPWRNGQINAAIGLAGMDALVDYRGQQDPYGYQLHASVIAVADELAAAAELVMGKVERIPVALIRGYSYRPSNGTAHLLVRDSASDMFR